MMKLELNRQSFLRAWQVVEKFTSAKTTMDITRGVFITAKEGIVRLEATNLSTSINLLFQDVNVLTAGSAVIPAAIVGEMLKKSPSEDLILEVNSTRGLLNAGRHKTRFAVFSDVEFPVMQRSDTSNAVCELPVSAFIAIINEGSSASSQPQEFPKYLGTCLLRTSDNMLKCVATDGKRLSLSQAQCEVLRNEDFLLRTSSLKELCRTISSYTSEDSIKMMSSDSMVWFRSGNIEVAIRRIEAPFPKFERIINNDTSTTLKISAGDLLKSLERVDIIAKTTPAHIMAMSLNPNGELKITARVPELGVTTEVLQSDIEGECLNVGFNVGYFIDGLKAIGSGQVVIEFSGQEGQTRIKHEDNGDFLYMLMPARLTEQDLITAEENSDFQP